MAWIASPGRWLNLPAKTALLTTTLVLFLVGVTGAWQYRSLSDSYVTLMRQQQEGLARLAAADLDYKLKSHLDALTREARAIDPDVFTQPMVQQAFFVRSDLRPMFSGVALVAPDGRVVANDPPNPKAISIADRAYFQQALESGRPVISPPLQSRNTDQPAVVMLVPVQGEDARVVGLLGAGLDLDRPNVLGDLVRARIVNEGYYLIETAGPDPVYVVHPDPQRVLKAAVHRDDDSSGDLTASAAIPSTGWTLRVVLPARAAYAPLAKARDALRTQMLVLAVVCSVLVWLGTLWMLRPLGALHKAIAALRRSPDSAVTLDVDGHDELGDLAREFDALMAELRNRRTEMATVTDASPLGLFRCDTEGRMVYVNEAYLEMHGLARADAPQGWLQLVPEKHRAQVMADWQRLAKEKEPFQVTRWLRRLDGRELLVALHMRPILAEGRVVGQVGTLSDITQRTRAEQALRTLTAIFEATTDYVVQLDKTGQLTYMNPAARQCTGIPLDAPIAHLSMRDFNPPATLARFQSEVVPTAVAKGSWVGESYIWNAGHEPFPVSHMVIAHRDKNGKIDHFSAIMRDISAAKATELALLESQARLATVADAMPMRVAYIGTDERYQFVNLAYEGVFGVPRDSIPGQTVRQLFGEDRYRVLEPHIRTALAGERVTFQNETASATDYACHEVNYIPQTGADGVTVVGFHAVTTDITRQKREERRLFQLASQDALTGLGNRASFGVRLTDAMARSRAQGTPMALMYLDLDRFKQINDRFGHPCGDALLKAVSARLTQATRSTDFVARLGGDEFTVVLESLRDPDDAMRVAQKILKAMSDAFVLDGRTLNVSASVGVAWFEGGSATDEQLIRLADEMLYQAKGAGRNNFQMAAASVIAVP